MKISELIVLLSKIQDGLGDCDIHVEYSSDFSKLLFTVDDVNLMKSGSTNYISLTCDQTKYTKLTKKDNEIL